MLFNVIPVEFQVQTLYTPQLFQGKHISYVELYILSCSFTPDTQRFVWEIIKKSWVWNDFRKNMCSKDMRPLLNFTQKLDSFGETLFFYPVANTFSQTDCQIPPVTYEQDISKRHINNNTKCAAQSSLQNVHPS